MTIKLRITGTFVREIEVEVDWYEEGATVEQIVAYETTAAGTDPEYFMDCDSSDVKCEVLSG